MAARPDEDGLVAAGAGLGQTPFGHIVLALLFGHLIQIGSADEGAELDVLADEVVLAGFHEHFQCVRRKLGFRFDRVLLAAFDLRVEDTSAALSPRHLPSTQISIFSAGPTKLLR